MDGRLAEGDRIRLIGVDGCRGGWVIAESQGPTEPPAFRVEPTFASLLTSLAGQRALIAVDMPIGLPGGPPPDDGRRRADGEARKLLGRRGVSVFPAPCWQALAALDSYTEACRITVETRGWGKGISRQTFAILPKIHEVDCQIEVGHQARIGTGMGIWVREAHPELTFAELNGHGGKPRFVANSKHVLAGEADRLALLCAWFGAFDPGAMREQIVRASDGRVRLADVGRDDIVDAVACLATAQRIVTGRARTLPDGAPQVDRRGLRMEIVA